MKTGIAAHEDRREARHNQEQNARQEMLEATTLCHYRAMAPFGVADICAATLGIETAGSAGSVQA